MQEAKTLGAVGDDLRHQHAVLAEQMGFGNHAFVLPLIYSSLAGLSTGIGGMFVLCVRGNALVEVSLTAFMLAVAAAAMITVSIVDLFYHIAGEIGLNHTIIACLCGICTVVMAKKIGSIVVPSTKADNSPDVRLLRVGLITALTLTAHNLPEGMAVAISTLGSVTLGLKLALAIALHNIPEGLAIACPLMMSKRHTPFTAVMIAFASGLSEPVGALFTLLVFQNVITQARVDYALAFVGGVMMAVATLELIPEARRLEQHRMTLLGLVCGTVIMGVSLAYLD